MTKPKHLNTPSGFLSVLLLTGMRKSEALNMEWSWIDRKTQQILVPPEITKTKHKRAIPMTRALSGPLSTWPRTGDRVFVLSGKSGHLDAMYYRSIEQAGIRRLKLHNPRDTFAVQSLLSGVPLAVESAILGHASVVTTIKHYASIAGEELRIAADRKAEFSTAILLRSGESRCFRWFFADILTESHSKTLENRLFIAVQFSRAAFETEVRGLFWGM